MDANKEKLLKKELDALDELQVVAKWVSNETYKRKYKTAEIKTLSDALVNLKKYIKSS